MSRRARSAALVALAGCVLLGATACATPRPIQRFTLVTTDPGVVAPRILEEGVTGQSCFTQSVLRVVLTPPWRARRANHGYAVADALAKVPEANILTNVQMRVRVEQYLLFQRSCALVTGDAGVIR